MHSEQSDKQLPRDSLKARTNSDQKRRYINLKEMLFGRLTERPRGRKCNQKLNSTTIRRSLSHFKMVYQIEKRQITVDTGVSRLYTSQLSKRDNVRAYVPMLE